MASTGSVGKPFTDCEFEIDPIVFDLTGSIRSTVYEEGGVAPTGIINTGQNWYVLVEWSLIGSFIHHLCGKFCVCLYIECIGGGFDKLLGCVNIDFDPCGDGHYSVKIEVPAGTVPVVECGRVCCLAVTLGSTDSCVPPHPGHINAFCSGPCISFTPVPV